MRWDLEEKLEDALVSYLISQSDGSVRIFAAWDRDERQYPCAVVHVAESGPVSEPAAWHDSRELMAQVAVMTEGADEVDSDARTIRTARQRNADARSEIMNALAIADLNAQLVLQDVPDLALSMAQVTTTQRTVENQYLVTTINVECIVEPVTGS